MMVKLVIFWGFLPIQSVKLSVKGTMHCFMVPGRYLLCKCLFIHLYPCREQGPVGNHTFVYLPVFMKFTLKMAAPFHIQFWIDTILKLTGLDTAA